MSPKLKILSGAEVVKIFERYGFVVVRTKGSHVRMDYKNVEEKHISIPLHSELKRGTLRNIVKEFEACFGLEKAKEEFFSK